MQLKIASVSHGPFGQDACKAWPIGHRLRRLRARQATWPKEDLLPEDAGLIVANHRALIVAQHSG